MPPPPAAAFSDGPPACAIVSVARLPAVPETTLPEYLVAFGEVDAIVTTAALAVAVIPNPDKVELPLIAVVNPEAIELVVLPLAAV